MNNKNENKFTLNYKGLLFVIKSISKIQLEFELTLN